MQHAPPHQNKLGHKFKILSNTFQRAVQGSLTELDITPAQSFLLGYLSFNRDTPPSQKRIEETFNIKHPTANGILARLSDKGYVTFCSDTEDKRVKRVMITPEGISAAEATRESLEDVEKRFSAALSEDELQTLHRLLDKLVSYSAPDDTPFDSGKG